MKIVLIQNQKFGTRNKIIYEFAKSKTNRIKEYDY